MDEARPADEVQQWWKDFVTSVNAWNAWCKARPVRRARRPVDSLAVVRPFAKPLSGWNYHTKNQAVVTLLEEEERRRAEGYDTRHDD